jgi:hypothetical protein
MAMLWHGQPFIQLNGSPALTADDDGLVGAD